MSELITQIPLFAYGGLLNCRDVIMQVCQVLLVSDPLIKVVLETFYQSQESPVTSRVRGSRGGNRECFIVQTIEIRSSWGNQDLSISIGHISS